MQLMEKEISLWNESEDCTEGDTDVNKSYFLPLLFESNQSFLFFFILVFLLLTSFVFVNPNDSNSLRVALPLQISLMAYGDG